METITALQTALCSYHAALDTILQSPPVPPVPVAEAFHYAHRNLADALLGLAVALEAKANRLAVDLQNAEDALQSHVRDTPPHSE